MTWPMLGAAVRIALLLAASAAHQPAPAQSAPILASPGQPRAISILGEAIAFVPSSVSPSPRTAPPVLVLLHGAGRDAQGMIRKFAFEAEARGIVLLAPTSHGGTWDVIGRSLKLPMRDSSGKLDGPFEFRSTRDSRRVEAAITELGRHIAVERNRIVLAGFSDGATFALALGLSRDHQFGSVIAFSPGLAIAVARPASRRAVLVSHGRQDPVLPYDRTCEGILPALRARHEPVIFRPFDGRHQIPAEVMTEFLDQAFGPRPGTAPRPIAADRSECTRIGLPPVGVPEL